MPAPIWPVCVKTPQVYTPNHHLSHEQRKTNKGVRDSVDCSCWNTGMWVMCCCPEGGDSESYHSKSKAKRVRTTFTEEQLQVLQANFQLDSNPDGQDLERIAQITGLSKRVTQVWFQNSRARQKKHLNTGKMKSSHCKLSDILPCDSNTVILVL